MKGIDEPLNINLRGKTLLIHGCTFYCMEPDNLVTYNQERDYFEITGISFCPSDKIKVLGDDNG